MGRCIEGPYTNKYNAYTNLRNEGQRYALHCVTWAQQKKKKKKKFFGAEYGLHLARQESNQSGWLSQESSHPSWYVGARIGRISAAQGNAKQLLRGLGHLQPRQCTIGGHLSWGQLIRRPGLEQEAAIKVQTMGVISGIGDRHPPPLFVVCRAPPPVSRVQAVGLTIGSTCPVGGQTRPMARLFPGKRGFIAS